MYIWVGIDVDEQLQEIKQKGLAVEKEIGFELSNFNMPLHISLKISFEVPDGKYGSISHDILNLFKNTPAFDIPVKSIDYEGCIAWIRMGECPKLRKFSTRLNNMLLEQYGIPLHEYDTDYKFHTTLFIHEDEEKVKRGYEALKDFPLPSTLRAHRFAIGTSDEGKPGTYKVHTFFVR